MTKDDWRAFRLYSKSHQLWEHVLRETSTGVAPWYVVEGADERYRNLTVGKILLSAINSAIAAEATAPKRAATPPPPSVIDNVKLIRDLDLAKKLSGEGSTTTTSASIRASSRSSPATSALRIIR